MFGLKFEARTDFESGWRQSRNSDSRGSVPFSADLFHSHGSWEMESHFDKSRKVFDMYSNYRNYAPLLDVKGGIITEKVFPVFSESFFWTCFGLVMYIWVLMDVTEKLAFQM